MLQLNTLLWLLLFVLLSDGLNFLGNSYNTEERVVCAGYDNGDIKMFDLKTMSLRWETNVKNGVSLSVHLTLIFLVSLILQLNTDLSLVIHHITVI